MKAKTKKYKYMHTLDGKPARFNGDQVCYAEKTWPANLVSKLETIREHQSKSAKWRASKNYPTFFMYDYIRVYV